MNNLFTEQLEPSLSDLREVRTLASLSMSDNEYRGLNSYLTSREWENAHNLAESMVKMPCTDTTLKLENKLFEISVNYGTKTKLQQT